MAVLSSAVLLTGVPAVAQKNDEPVTSAQVDLDGDGKPEAVSLTAEGGGFTLKAGAATAQGNASGGEVRGFTVVDLATGDKWKELVVQSPGITDEDHHVLVYGYDGKALKLLGDVHALSEATGNGIVLVDTWMNFWQKRDKYTLDRKAWKLVHVPQELYAVGVDATSPGLEATVTKPFQLKQDRSGHGATVAVTAQGSKVRVLAASVPAKATAELWYLVKSSTGLLGWVLGKTLVMSTEGLPRAG
ncbi:hypothetical protein JYK02_21695 [Corallococcus macrosporus]|uniref:VCBS repeat-containing protein n=1 Tax=Corallococcus macrosporus TaxID=35 RepID=A0ABS3DFN0_9BACT|nr:hypothetical protein [Corallococcus macrosporus]